MRQKMHPNVERFNPGLSTGLTCFSHVKRIKQVPDHPLKSVTLFCDTRVKSTRHLYRQNGGNLLHLIGALLDAFCAHKVGLIHERITLCAHTPIPFLKKTNF